MSIPPRVFWSLPEVTARWNCTPAHVCGLAYHEEFSLVTSVPLVRAGNDCTERIAGLVQLAASDLLRFLRADAMAPKEWRVHRVLPLEPPSADWVFVTDPVDGLSIQMEDLMIRDSDVARFEAKYGIHGSRFVTTPVGEPKYPWEAFYAALCAHVHENGLPATQKELVETMADWFATNSPDGEVPDMRTIRRRIMPVWRAVRADDGG